MMLQVNLLPDIKAEYLKTQRTKRFVMLGSFITASVFVITAVIMFTYVNVAQRKHGNDLTDDIISLVNEYKNSGNVAKIVTVQKQLAVLSSLHADKPLISRVVKYLAIITPEQVEYRSVDVNFESQQFSITGIAKTFPDVNRYANTLKNAFYTISSDNETKITPFSNVVLNSINSDNEGTRFDIQFTFDPQVFVNHDDIVLSVPAIDSTTSNIESPSLVVPDTTNTDLFNGSGN